MTNFQEVMEKLKSGAGASTLRDSRAAQQQKRDVIPTLKKEKKMAYRLIIPTDLEIPFDPMTGKVSEVYNETTPFRPSLSVRTVVGMIKEKMSNDPELVQFYQKRAGVSEYNFTPGNYGEEDFKIFKDYIKARIFTIPVIQVNDPAISGKYPAEYQVDFKRDPDTGEWESNSIVLQLSKFFNGISWEKRNFVKQQWENAKNGMPFDLSQVTIPDELRLDPSKLRSYTEEDLKTKIFNNWSDDSAVKGPYASNYLVCYALELDRATNALTSEVSSMIQSGSPEKLKETWKKMRYGADLRKLLENRAEWLKRLNMNPDFIEVLMTCDCESDNPMFIGKETKYTFVDSMELTDKVVPNAKLINAHSELCLETWETMDKIYRSSLNYVKKYTESTEALLVNHFAQKDLLTSPWVTEEIKQMNQVLIQTLYPEVADELACLDEIPTDRKTQIEKEVEEVSLDLTNLGEVEVREEIETEVLEI